MQSESGAAESGDSNAIDDLLRNRRTINLFEPEPVGEDALLLAIEAARWAPNHRLTEPWRFYIVTPDTKEKIACCAADIDAAAKGARAGEARFDRMMAVPAGFVLTSQIDADELVDRENYAACCCAAQNLMLSLWSRGIGTKWTTGAVTRAPALYDLLGIDSKRELVVGYFWYGTPRIVPEQQRQPVEDITTRV